MTWTPDHPGGRILCDHDGESRDPLIAVGMLHAAADTALHPRKEPTP